MKIKRYLAGLVGALALCLAMVGCGGSGAEGGSAGSGSAVEENPRAQFVGTWQLYEADYADDDYDADPETIQLMADELGLVATIDMDDEGNLLFDMFGETYEGSWEVKDASTVTITIQGDSEDCAVADDLLTLERDGDSLIFKHVDSTPDMDHSDNATAPAVTPVAEPEETVEEAEGTDTTLDDLKDPEADANALAYIEDVTEVRSISGVSTSDENVTITAYAIGSDYEGDPGVLISVENKTGDDIFLVSDSDFTVNGSYADATLFRHINAGETTKAYLFFASDEVGDASGIQSITGTIDLYDGNGDYVSSYSLDIQ